MTWTKVSAGRWRRHDGAEVWITDLANPNRPDARAWVAAGPRACDQMRRRMRLDRPERTTPLRRFATAAAAMAAVEEDFPRQGALF